MTAAAVALLPCGCVKDNLSLPAETGTEEETPEPAAHAAPVEVTLDDYTDCPTGVSELSGICFNAARDGFFAVSDRGGLYEIDLDGTTVRQLLSSGNDLEAVALSGDGAVIYAVDESTGEIISLSGKDYGTRSTVATVTIPGGGKKNRGPEGMTFQDGTLIIANQAEPAKIVDFSLAGKKIERERTVTFATYLSDLCYDGSDGTLWILDSKSKAVYHCTQDLSLLGTYKIPFVAQAEALEVDHARNCLWIGCDTTAKLYKVSFAF